MSSLTVAKKEFQDAIRSRWLIGLTVVFVVFAGGFTLALPSLLGLLLGPTVDTATTGVLLTAMGGSTTLLIPLIGLVVGYKSIVGERDSGSLKLLLGLPHTRRDVVIGKLVGRSAVVAVSTLIGFVVAAVVGVAVYSSFEVGTFLTYTVLAMVLGVVFIAIATGFSAGVRSTTWALLGAGGLYLLFQFVWGLIPTVVRYVINGFSLPSLAQPPNWQLFFSLLNPQTAFTSAAAAVIPSISGIATALDSPPIYLQNWFGFVVLAAWIVVPIALGYLRFNGTDL
ncbi:ABC transporter permease subunit [Halococcus salsus]|uniref:ABC transporter permease subunit n=1 Tax=Halococcus salsus TaxID=2162894 RepID=UPI001359BFF3|nr:ABC transporter permease subunit [Halococcus salsus]